MKRFTYITPATGGTLHIAFGKLLEGEKVACGIRIRPRWKYGQRRYLEKKPVCAHCVPT